MPFQIQYISDLHLEHHDSKDEGYIIPSMFLKPSAPYLALCGDIGNPDLQAYEALLSWCSKTYRLVFLVAGNHEYYNYRSQYPSDIPTRKQKIRSIVAKFENVIFLDCSSYLLAEHNLRILGCTLWSDTRSGNDHMIVRYMNDARNILLTSDRALVPSQMTALHLEEREWLESELQSAEGRGEQVLVLTHYLPSFKLIAEKYKENPLNMCFASNCEHLIRPPVKAWICGHSHTGMKVDINGVICRMNPHGYPGERVETRSSSATLQIPFKEEVIDL